MTEHADSALHILQKFNNPQHLYGENAALYALLMTQAQYKNYIPVENDSLIHIAVRLLFYPKRFSPQSMELFLYGTSLPRY